MRYFIQLSICWSLWSISLLPMHGQDLRPLTSPYGPLENIAAITQEATDLLETSSYAANDKAWEALQQILEIKNNGYLHPDFPEAIPREEVMGYELRVYYVMVSSMLERRDYKEANKYLAKGKELASQLDAWEYAAAFNEAQSEIDFYLTKKKKGLGRLIYSAKRGIEKTIAPEMDKVGDEVGRMMMQNAEKNAEESLAKGELVKATRNYLDALRYADKLNDTLEFIHYQNRLAELYLELGKYNEARTIAEASRTARISPFVEDGFNEDTAAGGLVTTSSTQVNPFPSQPEPVEPLYDVLAKSLDNVEAPAPPTSTSRNSSLSTQLARMEASLRRRLEDSVVAAKRIEENQQVIERLQLESQRKELILKEQEFDLKRKRNQLAYFVIGSAAIVSIALLMYLLFMFQRRANKKLKTAYDQLQSAQLQLVESEKMASLGQLTAGVAHEINNPVNFISGNVLPLKRDMGDLIRILDSYEHQVKSRGLSEEFQQVEKEKEAIDLAFVKEEILLLLDGIEEGASRTAEIVKELRNFARMDEVSPKLYDIHYGLDSTLALLKHKTQAIEIKKSYGTFDPIFCLPGKLNQVFMNILTNAMQSGGKEIEIETQKIDSKEPMTEGQIKISIKDNGSGIPKEVLPHIFNPFYTTKEVGEGTGLGLSISKGIVEQHGGSLRIESREGEGTEVLISIPEGSEKNLG